MYSKRTTIKNQTGLHARPASEFIAMASKFSSRITIKNRAKLDYESRFADVDTMTELVSLPAEYLNTIRLANDIFTLEKAVTEMFHTLKLSLKDAAGMQGQLAEKARKYIAENIADDLSLEMIADALHISASHLSRTFKKAAGISLTDYINQFRINRAKELLRGTDIYIYAISEMVGYHDATYFSSMFKKLVGVSPSEYRNVDGN